MSKRDIRRQSKPPQPIVAGGILRSDLSTVLIMLAAVYLAANWIHSFPSPHETATGTVLEIRKVIDNTRDALYGGKISYRLEAQVQYVADGQMQDRWLRALDDLTRESLLLKLAKRDPTKCLVYWPPNHPENAKCSLK